jgi:hypothetical protein
MIVSVFAANPARGFSIARSFGFDPASNYQWQT